MPVSDYASRSIRRLPKFGTRGTAVLLAVLGVIGFSLGSVTIHSDPSVTGAGTLNPGKLLAYWAFHAATPTTIPGTVPGAVSTSAAAPTVLAASSSSYTLNTATGGHSAVEWSFLESSSAPTNTEIEVTFTVTVGSPGTTSTVTAYVETQGTVSTSLLFNFYFDAGGGALVFDSALELSQPCSSVGSCA
ncbi:MAG: hypothetical protein L3K13_06260 [Thermoplasmata archaeon]|nr:hypothetical protein [Thermoplasmata archaeon]